MPNRAVIPLAAATTAAIVCYAFSPYSKSKSLYKVPPVTIQTNSSAQEIYVYFRDPAAYLNLTPESQYTVVSSNESPYGVDYTLHHQVSDSRSVVTECRRDWNDEKMVFWDTFPVLSTAFTVKIKVIQEGEGAVKVEAEMEIDGSAGLRAFFGWVSPRQVRTRLERLQAKFEGE
jgi:hypothetical protein